MQDSVMSNMGGHVDGNDSIISVQGGEPDEEAKQKLPFLPHQSNIT
jgi:hypothetical protein